nr:hypothetical protein OH820_25500 [Streptomyces sp. NBC_00857]
MPTLSLGTGEETYDGDRLAPTTAYATAAATLALGIAAGPVLDLLDGELAV